ncbi:hypothetical protein [Frigoriglobus tundricola]|uniref:Uncharacterized protein n=1 Tax=Frigoriglobus tundricola TaxID=2774151 RepID=A0A6M5YX48_9BACT|nr:hypothetical protein [Frigoriglobus tundricola]QJW97966.1 hypothetical protein FTUN_5546 [Frigoriglobus tundricola]
MKRWYLVAVAGLWSFAPLSGQEGTLAPTAPMVPAPVLQGGSPGSPNGTGAWSTGSGGTRTFSLTKWAPFRSPATASTTEPMATSAATYGQPLPASAIVSGGACGAGGCSPIDGHRSHERMTWSHLKAWMCYHPSNTEMPRCRPTPYTTSPVGMYACSSVGGGCGTGCASGCAAGPLVIHGGQPQGAPMPPPAQPGAGAVGSMPPRGVQGGAAPTTWQTRTTPAPTTPGIAGYRYATIPTTGAVVPTGLQTPASK